MNRIGYCANCNEEQLMWNIEINGVKLWRCFCVTCSIKIKEMEWYHLPITFREYLIHKFKYHHEVYTDLI